MAQAQGLALGDGFWPFVFIFLAGFLATEPWRFMGAALSRNLNAESEILIWVRAVSTALVAGLVARMVLFPVGALESVPLGVRLGAFALGVATFFIAGRIMALGVAAGATAILVGQYLFPG